MTTHVSRTVANDILLFRLHSRGRSVTYIQRRVFPTLYDEEAGWKHVKGEEY